MEAIYKTIEFLLPFQWAGHEFMKNALIAVLLVTPLFGILGTMVVSNRMAFFSDALGHGAYTGIAIGVLMGSFSPMWGAVLFAVLFALSMTLIKNKSRESTDTIIGVFSSTAIALGLVLLTLGGNFNKFAGYLVGDLLSITQGEILLLGFVFLGAVLLWVFLFNRLLLISVNESLASSRGINTKLTEAVFTCATAVVVTITIQWVGLLIINSLLVLPAASAKNISRNIRQYHLLSVLIAMISGVLGLILSYYWNTSAGATIVMVCSSMFFITLAARSRLKG